MSGAGEREDMVLASFPRGESEELRVLRSKGTYNGRPYLNTSVRIFFEKDGAWFPTKKGVTIRDTELPNLVAALGRIVAKLAKEGSR